MNVDKPPSQANYKENEYDIADFVNEEDAKFIAGARQDVTDLIKYIKALEKTGGRQWAQKIGYVKLQKDFQKQ